MHAFDLFSGAGGMTLGAEGANLTVTHAFNHWQPAIETHSRNHPSVIHACEDIHRVCWSALPRVPVVLASPACQGHSRARGLPRTDGNLKHETDRQSAWGVIDCLEHIRPEYLLVENVPEFIKWDMFDVWVFALKRLGYSSRVNLVNSADAGVPQSRPRMILTAVKGKVAPDPLVLNEPHVPAHTIIDWDAGNWEPVHGRKKPYSAATLHQIECGRKQHGERFLIPYYGSERKRGNTCSVYAPLRTVTTKERFGVYRDGFARMVSVREYARAQGFPETYWFPSDKATAVKLIGNAAPSQLITASLRQLVK